MLNRIDKIVIYIILALFVINLIINVATFQYLESNLFLQFNFTILTTLGFSLIYIVIALIGESNN